MGYHKAPDLECAIISTGGTVYGGIPERRLDGLGKSNIIDGEMMSNRNSWSSLIYVNISLSSGAWRSGKGGGMVRSSDLV